MVTVKREHPPLLDGLFIAFSTCKIPPFKKKHTLTLSFAVDIMHLKKSQDILCRKEDAGPLIPSFFSLQIPPRSCVSSNVRSRLTCCCCCSIGSSSNSSHFFSSPPPINPAECLMPPRHQLAAISPKMNTAPPLLLAAPAEQPSDAEACER